MAAARSSDSSRFPESAGDLTMLLSPLAAGQSVSIAVQNQLAAHLLSDSRRACAFGITDENVSARVAARLQYYQTIYPTLEQFCQQELGWSGCPADLLWDLWLPLAEQLVNWRQRLGRPLIQGILGGQGTGKTTLTRILSPILTQMGCPVCRLSIDDLYKPYAERLQLQQQDPRFRWRGPPGTHDVNLGLAVLRQLRQPDLTQPVAVPRFDKSAYDGAGDRTQPEWVIGAEIVLFEGWFVGVRPVEPTAFDDAPPPIVNDADRAFARAVNERLRDYLPLWDQLDRLILLHPQDYRLSQQWRWQAEQQMMASGRAGMDAAEVNAFVEYFWRALHPELFITPLLQDAEHVDLVIELDVNHQPQAIYRPESSTSFGGVQTLH